MVHTCTPARWRPAGPAAPAEPLDAARHTAVAVGTVFGFAEAQLQAAVLTGFQVLLRHAPWLADAVADGRRFPSWEAAAGHDAACATALLQALQCRRLAEALAGERARGCRAMLAFAGWHQLANDSDWRRPLPASTEPAPHAHGNAVLNAWVRALLRASEPAGPDDDEPRDLRELAACSFKPWQAPGEVLATLCVTRLDRGEAPATLRLLDALAGQPQARAEVTAQAAALAGGAPWPDGALQAVLVAALNPPLCLTLLAAEDPVPGWDGLQPGRRFAQLCRAWPALTPPAAQAPLAERLRFVDALCLRCGGPPLSLQLERAAQARQEVAATPGLAAVGQWLADHWSTDPARPPRSPPGTYACTRWLAFLEAFVATKGGLDLAVPARAQAQALFRCDPAAAFGDGVTPTGAHAALLCVAAAGVVADLLDGETIDAALARVLPPLAGLHDAAATLGAVLRLPAVASFAA